MFLKQTTCLVVLFILGISTKASESDNVNHENELHKTPDGSQSDKRQNLTPLDIYRALLRQKRNYHKEAVESIFKIDDKYDKKYKMVQMLLEKIFKVLEDSKVKLMEMGFMPGDPFPEDEKVQDALSSVAENTAFLGDIVLHFPDVSHKIMKRHHSWDLIVRWSIGFCNDTNVFVDKDKKLLNLMAQELNVVEKDENYVNPYINELDVGKVVEEEIEKLMKEKMKEQEKKNKRKERTRGPRLRGTKTEL